VRPDVREKAVGHNRLFRGSSEKAPTSVSVLIARPLTPLPRSLGAAQKLDDSARGGNVAAQCISANAARAAGPRRRAKPLPPPHRRPPHLRPRRIAAALGVENAEARALVQQWRTHDPVAVASIRAARLILLRDHAGLGAVADARDLSRAANAGDAAAVRALDEYESLGKGGGGKGKNGGRGRGGRGGRGRGKGGKSWRGKGGKSGRFAEYMDEWFFPSGSFPDHDGGPPFDGPHDDDAPAQHASPFEAAFVRRRRGAPRPGL